MGDTWIAEPADSGCVMDLGLSDTSCTSASFSCRMDNHTQSFSLFLILLMVLLFMFVCFLAAFHKDRFQCVSECVDSPYLFGREILVLPRPLTSCCCTNPHNVCLASEGTWMWIVYFFQVDTLTTVSTSFSTARIELSLCWQCVTEQEHDSSLAEDVDNSPMLHVQL